MTTAGLLSHAATLIDQFGWKRNAFPMEYGPMPKSIRAALFWAAREADCVGMPEHTDALRFVSEAIYGPKHVGGITDWEHRKATNKAKVLDVLRKAAEAAESQQVSQPHVGMWPT